MATLLQDLRYGLRMLAKNPSFTAVAVVTLALGIGANTAIFSVINAVLLHPTGVSDPSSIVAVRAKYDKLNLKNIVISPTDFADIRDSRQAFSSSAIADEGDFNYVARDLPERLLGAEVSWQWFQTFGARPLMGRVFSAEEDQPHANHEVVLAYRTWKRLFGGDPSVIGATIQLNQEPYRVVGVMGPSFNWPGEAELWVPLGLAPADYGPANRYNETYFAVARIRPGMSFEQAQTFTRLLTQQDLQRDPFGSYAKNSGWGMFVMPLSEFMFGNLRTPMLVLLGAVGFVLLIACSNIAGLMLARASGRAKDLAVRAALGAGRWALIRQTLTESLLLAAAGTLGGLGLGYGGIRALVWLAPENLAEGLSIPMDTYVLLFTILVGVLSGILFGIAPAWQASAVQSFEALKEGGRSGTANRGRQRMRSGLVVGQVALALVLLVGSGLFLESLSKLERVNPGFDPRGVMTGALSLPESQYKEAAKQAAFYRAVTERLAGLPGATAAAAATPLPFSGSNSSASFFIEGRVLGPGDPGPHGDVRFVTPEYFSAMGISLLKGRFFTGDDRQGTEPVVLIDQNLARQYWPHEDPIGRRLRRGNRAAWATIVGVVGHVDHAALTGDSGKGVYYYPMFQNPVPSAYLVVKTKLRAASLAASMRAAVKSVDPTEPVHDLKTMPERVDGSLAPRRFAVTTLGFFAVVALLMAAIGLYGVVSFGVTQRTQEIGIRMALGAERRQVLTLILGGGMRLVAGGILIGFVAAFLLVRLLTSQLFEVAAFDPVTFLATALILTFVALVASFIPAVRATRVDPMVALRNE